VAASACGGCGAPNAAGRDSCAYCGRPIARLLRWHAEEYLAAFSEDQRLILQARAERGRWEIQILADAEPNCYSLLCSDEGRFLYEERGKLLGEIRRHVGRTNEAAFVPTEDQEAGLALREGPPTGYRWVDVDGNVVGLGSAPEGPPGEAPSDSSQLEVVALGNWEARRWAAAASLLLPLHRRDQC
jgi:hypothetical protein